jgi:glycerophosphoryl diester phosphodiesterase
MVMLELKQVYSLDLFLNIVKAGIHLSDLYLTSFNHSLIREIGYFAPELTRGILTSFMVEDPLKTMELSKSRIMLPQFMFTSAELVKTLHANQFSIMVWDCNVQDNIKTAVDWGVDGIITDSPDILTQELIGKIDNH